MSDNRDNFRNIAVDEIKQKIDIVTVIGRHVNLKRSGRNMKGLCPFHKEKTPSFFVSPDRQSFHCFGCGAGGDVISFLMDYLGLSFRDTLEELAQEAGIELTLESHPGRNDILRQIISESAEFFIRNFRSDSGELARAYLSSRKLSQDVIDKLRIGWAPGGYKLAKFLAGKNFSRSSAVEAGVLISGDAGKNSYDRFRNRLIFPITNRRGKCVSFGGRVLSGNSEPKYINGSDSPIYSKSEILYGFHEAARAARDADHMIIVEGYFDHARLVQEGYGAVVATCGTAMTSSQARQIAGSASEIFLCFDADEAGRKASFRALQMLLGAGVYPSVVILKDDMDPDSYLLSYGAGSFGRLLENALDPVSFVLFRLGGWNAMEKGGKKIEIVKTLIDLSLNAKNPIVRETLVKRINEKTGYSEAALYKELQKREKKESRVHHVEQLTNYDRSVLLALLASPEKLTEPLLEILTEDDLNCKKAKNLLKILKDQKEKGYTEPVLSEMDEDLRGLCSGLYSRDEPLGNEERNKLHDKIIDERKRKLELELNSKLPDADREEVDILLRKLSELRKHRKGK